MTDRQRYGFILLLVVGLIATSVVVVATKKTFLGLDLQGGVELVYQGEKTPQSNVTPAALSRAVDIMRNRVDQLGVSEPSITTVGGGGNDAPPPPRPPPPRRRAGGAGAVARAGGGGRLGGAAPEPTPPGASRERGRQHR